MNKIKDIPKTQLMFVLKDQLEAYKELLNLAKKKTDILVSGDVKQLDEITQVEQDLILTLGKLEEERYGIILELAKAYKKDAEDIKHDFIQNLLPREEAEAFSKITEELKLVLKQVDDVNKTNGKLIKQTLDFINLSIELLTDTGETKANYSADGTSTQKSFHFIDKKA